MLILASLFAAIIPMSLYLFLIWKMDKYEPEPIKFVISHFMWGAFGAIIFTIVFSSIAEVALELSFGVASPLVMTIFSAPFFEEITKGIFLTKTYRDKRFDNITDGLVYGAAIGLGFGMTENFFYFITYGDTFTEWIGIVVIRSGFSAVMHGIATGMFGAILGFVKYSTKVNKLSLISFGLILAMAIHAFWNASVSFESTFAFGFLFMFVIIGLFIGLYKFSLKAEEKLMRVELANELPHELIQIISTNARFAQGWIDERRRLPLIKAATSLAFRKRQFAIVKRNELQKEIDYLREQLNELMNENDEVVN